MRVVLADPPAFTPPYDHALAAALAAAGADVELVTSRFRFGAVAAPDGYRRRELFYPLSSRLFGRSRLRLPLKVLEHPFGLARLARHPADVLHVQWLAAPGARPLAAAPRAPLVLTAHDLLPRRTAAKRGSGAALFARFERIVVHSERGRETLAAFGVPEETLRVIPHPVTPSDPAADGRRPTVLALGLIRPYKQLEHAATSAVSRVPGAGELRVAGDAERRSSPKREIDRALGEATVAVFPYRAELDQSGALLQALGAGVPAVVYDVGGLAEPVRAVRGGTRRAARRRRRPRGGARRAARRRGGARGGARRRTAGARRADLGRLRAGPPRVYRELAVSSAASPSATSSAASSTSSPTTTPSSARGEDAERAYDEAERDEAEEAYGDYQLVLEAIDDRLGEIRDAYAATLDDDTAEAYERAFERAAASAIRSWRQSSGRHADRGLRPDRRPADCGARRPERLDRLALPSALRLGRVLRSAARERREWPLAARARLRGRSGRAPATGRLARARDSTSRPSTAACV